MACSVSGNQFGLRKPCKRSHAIPTRARRAHRSGLPPMKAQS